MKADTLDGLLDMVPVGFPEGGVSWTAAGGIWYKHRVNQHRFRQLRADCSARLVETRISIQQADNVCPYCAESLAWH